MTESRIHVQETEPVWDCPATALARYALDARIAVEDGREMPCPAAGGLLCGADECLANGCVEEGPPDA